MVWKAWGGVEGMGWCELRPSWCIPTSLREAVAPAVRCTSYSQAEAPHMAKVAAFTSASHPLWPSCPSTMLQWSWGALSYLWLWLWMLASMRCIRAVHMHALVRQACMDGC